MTLSTMNSLRCESPSDEQSNPSERDLKLINARKKLKHYQLKNSVSLSTLTPPTPPSASASTITPATTTGISTHSLSPNIIQHPTSATFHSPSHSRTNSRTHARTHSRNQSRSSLASILVSNEQVHIIDSVLAHQRRLSSSHSPSFNPNTAIQPPSLSFNPADQPEQPSQTRNNPIKPHHAHSTSFHVADNHLNPHSTSMYPRLSLPPPSHQTGSSALLSTTPPNSSTFHQRALSSSSSIHSLPQPAGHTRRGSKHQRQNSVSTRRESIEIMGGLGIMAVPRTPETNLSSSTRIAQRASWTATTPLSSSASRRADSLFHPTSTPASGAHSPLHLQTLHQPGAKSQAYQPRSPFNSAFTALPSPARQAFESPNPLPQTDRPITPSPVPSNPPAQLGQVTPSNTPKPSSISVASSADSGPPPADATERARLAALSALEGNPSSQLEVQALSPLTNESNSSTPKMISTVSQSDGSLNSSGISFTIPFSHSPFLPSQIDQRQWSIDSAGAGKAVSRPYSSPPSPTSNPNHPSAARIDQRLSWNNTAAMTAQSNGIRKFSFPPLPSIGTVPCNVEAVGSGLTLGGNGGMGVVRDLSRVEEEEEEEEEEGNLLGSNDDNDPTLTSVVLPRAIDPVSEAEEEEEQEDEGDKPVVHPPQASQEPVKPATSHPLANSQPSRLRPKSLIFSPASSSGPTALQSLGSAPILNSFRGSDVPRPLAGYGSPSPSPLANQLPLSAGSNGTSSFSSSGSAGLIRFERRGSRPGAFNNFGEPSPSSSTSRSSFGSATGSAPGSSNSHLSGKAGVAPRSRRSISYCKSPSPERTSKNSSGKPALAISTGSPSPHSGIKEINYAMDSPTTSVCSSAASRTSSQADRSLAHEAWKQSLAKSLDNQVSQPCLNQHQITQSGTIYSVSAASGSVVGGFGDLVMDGCSPAGTEEAEQEATEEDEGRSVLRVQLLRAREEAGRVRTQSEGVRASLERKIEDLEAQLAIALEKPSELPNGTHPEDSNDLRADVESWRQRVEELEQERNELLEDVGGFKTRVKSLEDELRSERTQSAERTRELQEKDQMVTELLKKREKRRQAKSGTSMSDSSSQDEAADSSVLVRRTKELEEEEEEAQELKLAQAKLINEMRDQIFALASALAKERADHLVTKDALEAAAMQIEVNDCYEEGPALTMFTDDECSLSDEPISSSYRRGVDGYNLASANVATPSTFEFVNLAAKSDPSQTSSVLAPASTNTSSSPSSNTCSLGDPCEPSKPVVGTKSTINQEKVDGSTGSEGSASSEPIQPATPRSGGLGRGVGAGNGHGTPKARSHRRSESFIRHWSFPKGPVKRTGMSTDSPDDHCFFFRPNSCDITLPPLEPSHDLLVSQPFLSSELQLEDDEGSEGGRIVETELANGIGCPLAPLADIVEEEEEDDVEEEEVGQANISIAAHRVAIPDSGVSYSSSNGSFGSSTGSGGWRERGSTERTGGGGGGGLKEKLSLQNLSSWVGSYVSGNSGGNADGGAQKGTAKSNKASSGLASGGGERMRRMQLEKLERRIEEYRKTNGCRGRVCSLGEVDFRCLSEVCGGSGAGRIGEAPDVEVEV